MKEAKPFDSISLSRSSSFRNLEFNHSFTDKKSNSSIKFQKNKELLFDQGEHIFKSSGKSMNYN
jgi:hypothetical protein